ncbi:hypothetical protein ALO43_200483 [Pseudomonas tremae]|uniref:GGDEF domain/EAL domain-containing protein n=1 Tax=Pseudomonas tremae TaxID=200454 RepID=A0AA40P4Y0_9PSED|nr:hypothetical protein ALO43_200483 [Pseudomonas tremae]
MNVIELLPHNLFAPHQFGMGSFLPNLINPVTLVQTLDESQTLQRALGVGVLKCFDYLSSRKRLETTNTFVQSGRLGHEVQMVFQYDIPEELQPLMSLLIAPGIQQNVHQNRPGKKR